MRIKFAEEKIGLLHAPLDMMTVKLVKDSPVGARAIREWAEETQVGDKAESSKPGPQGGAISIHVSLPSTGNGALDTSEREDVGGDGSKAVDVGEMVAVQDDEDAVSEAVDAAAVQKARDEYTAVAIVQGGDAEEDGEGDEVVAAAAVETETEASLVLKETNKMFGGGGYVWPGKGQPSVVDRNEDEVAESAEIKTMVEGEVAESAKIKVEGESAESAEADIEEKDAVSEVCVNEIAGDQVVEADNSQHQVNVGPASPLPAVVEKAEEEDSKPVAAADEETVVEQPALEKHPAAKVDAVEAEEGLVSVEEKEKEEELIDTEKETEEEGSAQGEVAAAATAAADQELDQAGISAEKQAAEERLAFEDEAVAAVAAVAVAAAAAAEKQAEEEKAAAAAAAAEKQAEEERVVAEAKAEEEKAAAAVAAAEKQAEEEKAAAAAAAAEKQAKGDEAGVNQAAHEEFSDTSIGKASDASVHAPVHESVSAPEVAAHPRPDAQMALQRTQSVPTLSISESFFIFMSEDFAAVKLQAVSRSRSTRKLTRSMSQAGLGKKKALQDVGEDKALEDVGAGVFGGSLVIGSAKAVEKKEVEEDKNGP